MKLYPWIRWITHAAAWIWLAWLTFAAFSGRLTANPIQAYEQRIGDTALTFLFLSLACTPVHILTGYTPILKLTRTLGLYAFMFAMIHVTVFVAIDYGFAWGELWRTLLEKRYIIVGSLVFLGLMILAITSFRWSMRRLGKNWKRLHRIVYLLGGLVVLHYAWALKGDLFRLQGDVYKPLFLLFLLAFLLTVRIPTVRKWIISLR